VGYTINIPLPPKTPNSGFIYAVDELLLPIADQFKPEFVLVSAGFGAHHADQIAEMEMTIEGFAQYAKRVKQVAEKFSKGRMIALLEGGYDLKSLAYSVLTVFNILAELKLEMKDPYPLPRNKLSKGVRERI
jgi:acetoin utilization deacetylase AcuC-like enzyme